MSAATAIAVSQAPGMSTAVVGLDNLTSEFGDLALHSAVHDSITLEQLAIDYGAERPPMRVGKLRGSGHHAGASGSGSGGFGLAGR